MIHFGGVIARSCADILIAIRPGEAIIAAGQKPDFQLCNCGDVVINVAAVPGAAVIGRSVQWIAVGGV